MKQSKSDNEMREKFCYLVPVWCLPTTDPVTGMIFSCSEWRRLGSGGDQWADHSVQVVEKGKQIEGQFEPSLSCCSWQLITIHDRRRIIQSGSGHDRPVQVPVHMVRDQRHVQQERDPFTWDQEQHVEEDMDHVLRQHQWIQGVALVNRVLEVSL